MDNIEYKIIDSYTKSDQESLGVNGYVAEAIFAITKVVSEDHIALKAFFQPTLLEYIKVFESKSEEENLYSDIIMKRYSYGAYLDDELVGVVIVDPRRWNESLFIAEIEVSDKYRGEGIGKKLLEKVEEKAIQGGFRAIGLETQNTNVPAIRFFQNSGYEIAGIDTSLYSNMDLENEEVALFMRKHLVK